MFQGQGGGLVHGGHQRPVCWRRALDLQRQAAGGLVCRGRACVRHRGLGCRVAQALASWPATKAPSPPPKGSTTRPFVPPRHRPGGSRSLAAHPGNCPPRGCWDDDPGMSCQVLAHQSQAGRPLRDIRPSSLVGIAECVRVPLRRRGQRPGVRPAGSCGGLVGHGDEAFLFVADAGGTWVGIAGVVVRRTARLGRAPRRPLLHLGAGCGVVPRPR